MRIYIHYEPFTSDGELDESLAATFVYDLLDVTTSDDVLKWFVKMYNVKYKSKPLDLKYLELRDCHSERVSIRNTPLINFVSHGDDVFVHLIAGTVEALNLIKPASSRAEVSRSTPQNKEISTSREHAEPLSINLNYQTIRNELETALQSKQYRKARQICQTALKSGFRKEAYLFHTLSKIFFNNNDYDKAVEYSESAISSLASSKHIRGVDVMHIHLQYAMSLLKSGQYDEAELATEKLFDAIGGFDSAVKDSSLAVIAYEGLAIRAESLFERGRVSQAAELVNYGLGKPGAEEQPSLLCAYAYFALKHDKLEDSLRSLLKVLVTDKTNKRGKQLLGQVLRYDGGADLMYSQVSPTAQSAPAFAYVASVAKDYSALKSSAALYLKCVNLIPTQPAYVLAYAHTLELTFEYDKAIKAALNFWIKTRMNRIGTSVENYNGKMIAELLEELPIQQLAILWKTSPDPLNREGKSVEFAKIFNLNEPMNESERNDYCSEEYNDESLENLALAMTIVKILYLQGNLPAVIALLRIIDPTRVRSKTFLHETNIRNENAYYTCIAQTLAYATCQSDILSINHPSESRKLPIYMYNPLKSDVYSEAAKSPIYVVGDSHIIPLSWGVVDIRGKKRLLVPKLVTGIKAWHLRPESEFYTKANFNNAIASIPNGSDVIFVLGEIDCREGLPLAVERDRYASVEEGMTATVKIFVRVLQPLITKRKFKAFIHPVLPMMTPTAGLVSAYNTAYKKQIASLPGSAWLDILPSILREDGILVREDLSLDGTHISPAYISIIEKELLRIPLLL